jgi:DNA-binding CsgD family transcriptional regulator
MEALMTAQGCATDIHRSWLSGDYAGAIFLLRQQPRSAARDLLLAQAYLRTSSYTDLFALLCRNRATDAFSEVDLARANAMVAVSYAATGYENEALSAIAAARASNVKVPEILAEIRLNDALVAWMLQDNARASRLISPYIAAHGAELDSSIAARFLMLRGWLLAAEERYTEQVDTLLEAIRRLQSAEVQDVGLLAYCLHPLAALLRDISIPNALDLVLRLEESIPWTADLSMARFQTLRAVASTYTVKGQYINAFRKFNTAKLCAPNEIAKMLVHLDQAECAQFSGQNLVCAAELAEANDLIRAYDWTTAVGEEARVLIQAAESFALNDAGRAYELLELAKDSRYRMRRNVSYVHDRRIDAYSDYAEALIRQANSDRRLARHRAERAYEVFASIGYQWRAAQCALLLHRLGKGAKWLARARDAIAPYPRSFIAEQIAGCSAAHNPMHTLTARQREILEHLCAAKTIDEISYDLRISPNTVRVHITRIHQAFKVERRSQLLREVAKYQCVA